MAQINRAGTAANTLGLFSAHQVPMLPPLYSITYITCLSTLSICVPLSS